MGLFDRFRSSSAPRNQIKADTGEQDATRLIEKGQAHEAENRIDDALQCYLEAIVLAPTLARAHLNHGNALLAKGDLNGALEAFRTAIRHKPDYAGAYYNMGNALVVHRRFDEAVTCYRSALEIKPDYAEAHCSLGVALKELGRFEGAVASFKRAITLNSGLVEAHDNLNLALNDLYKLGNALASRGQLEQAVASYSLALKINHEIPEVHCNLGLALQELGQLEEAVARYHRALEINPDLAEAHGNLGSALQKLGDFENAVASYRHAVKLQPDFVEAHSNLGLALQNIGRFEEAIASCQRALEINPNYAEAHNNLGSVLQTIGQVDRAMESYRRALKINPDLAETHLNLGGASHQNMKFEDAKTSYQRALALKPDFAEAHHNLGLVLKDLGQFDDAEACFLRALEIKPDYIEAHSSLLFVLNYNASHTPAYRIEQARKYGRLVSEKAGKRFSAWQCPPRPERLRVGLVSGDLMSHPVGYFLEELLAHIDQARIELIAYPTHHKEDELTARIGRYFSAWKPLIGKNDDDAAQLIQADGVHILLDLSGHTGHNRLPVFARKPSPVQASWLGYFATTGLMEMDYLLADEMGVPETQRQQFTECIWYLPDTRLCFTAPKVELAVTPLPALASDTITFGCFQNLAKVGDNVLDVWGRIFAKLPNARLRIQCKQLGEQAQREVLTQRMQHYGITPERVSMHGPIPREGYLAAHAEVDMILDTFPYPGGTTTCEALWMGVPTLTLAGDSLLARQGASLLVAAGLKDWIASSKEEYITKAIAFAGDRHGLATLRDGLRQQVLSSPLFNAQRFARNFEDALWGMWQSNQSRQEKQV